MADKFRVGVLNFTKMGFKFCGFESRGFQFHDQRTTVLIKFCV